MTKELLTSCLELERGGCQDIQISHESCPFEFYCASSAAIAVQPDACVTLQIYRDDTCVGNPVREMAFPTWTQPGSPCYHDATMGKMSVKDQYCNPDTGNWHETVFVGSETCDISQPSWWQTITNLTFATHSCVGGVSLKMCEFSTNACGGLNGRSAVGEDWMKALSELPSGSTTEARNMLRAPEVSHN